MEGINSLTAKIKKIGDIARQQGAFVAFLLLLARCFASDRLSGSPFYYMREVLKSDIPVHLTKLPDGFEFSTFVIEDIEVISKHPERKGYADEQHVIKNFNRGDTCLGIKNKREIAGFTWFSVQENRSKFYQSKMKNNEGYLYDMFVFNAFRGHNLAPTLRYKNYEILKNMGRDTFYSITQCSNTASFRFKQKLGAEIVFLGLYINFFKKYSKTLVLKKFGLSDRYG